MIFTNNKPTWLKIILVLAIILILSTYIYLVKTSIKSTRGESYQPKVEERTGTKIRKISGEVDHGLYEIKIDDSTTVLLYRGVESCTMILEVICKESFNIPHFSGIKYFSKGIRYKYATDNLESLCDEQIYHIIDGYLVSFELFKSKFLLLEDWRDEQLNNLI